MKTKSSKQEAQNLKFKTSKVFLTALLFIFVTQFIAAQTIHTVDNRPESGAMFTTVAAAIAAATPGDIIHIHPSSTGYGAIAFNKTLTLIGLGHNPANADGIRAVVSSITFTGVSNNSVIKGLYITGNITSFGTTNSDGLHIINNRLNGYVAGYQFGGRSDDWVIEGNYFTGGGIDFYGYGSDNWRISNNWMNGVFSTLKNTTVIINNIFMYGTTSGKATVFTSCNSPIVANNIFLFTSLGTGVGLSNSTVNFQNCMTYSFTGTTLDPLGDGTGGNIDNVADPLFTSVPVNTSTDFYNNDYSLTAGSPGKGAGTDTTDLGIFGRAFDFDLNGRPDLTPYPTSINITNTVIAPGQSLNVDFKAAIKQ